MSLLLPTLPLLLSSSSNTKQFQFNVEWKSVTRLCHTKKVLTVNGKYPGPTVAVNEGDNVEIKVTNRVATNTTIHWHGVKQVRTGWADGPAYITQCPIGAGKSYVYKFSVASHRGTLWWHAHFSWQRASVYGAFIVYPRMPFPFSLKPDHHLPPIIFGEWWNADIDVVETEMMLYGGGPQVSDAYTINGLPGPLYPCSTSTKDTFVLDVDPGKTYLLRIINAALNDELFFAVANHSLTVVEIDGAYTKPFPTTAIMIAPGQTTNVLLTTDASTDAQSFIMAARPYLSSVFPFDNSTTVGFLRYTTTNYTKPPYHHLTLPQNLPALEDTMFATRFTNSLKSLASPEYPCRVPKTIDKRVITTISLNLQDCPPNRTCKGYRNKRFYASINNHSFVRPTVSLLQSHYYGLGLKNWTWDISDNPPHGFNYTGVDPVAENMNTNFGTSVLRVAFGTRLEIVLQGTNFLNPENHPIHIHGHNFFVVGSGFGNFDQDKNPASYNLVDPPERNTVAVPMGGWAAIRLVADNPGVWFVHCHLEEHTSWGLAMGFIVENGKAPSQCVLPPPTDLPPC
ncbi:Laccase-1 [Striga hermonthica]|uniref:Laccase n=1 Tax=Striga hermonthica TaxID=68872 RepID=A0A9N7NNL2_STRHE|nr:Laccase-1 [Striga hermonthica]